VNKRDGVTVVELASGAVPVTDAMAQALSSGKQAEVVVGARPEDIVISDRGSVTATVVVVEDLGHERQAACRLADGPLWIVRLGGRSAAPSRGDRVRLSLQRLHLFASDGTRLDV
jgi:ABC-type sugar transport system ATPase subunit